MLSQVKSVLDDQSIEEVVGGVDKKKVIGAVLGTVGVITLTVLGLSYYKRKCILTEDFSITYSYNKAKVSPSLRCDRTEVASESYYRYSHHSHQMLSPDDILRQVGGRFRELVEPIIDRLLPNDFWKLVPGFSGLWNRLGVQKMGLSDSCIRFDHIASVTPYGPIGRAFSISVVENGKEVSEDDFQRKDQGKKSTFI